MIFRLSMIAIYFLFVLMSCSSGYYPKPLAYNCPHSEKDVKGAETFVIKSETASWKELAGHYGEVVPYKNGFILRLEEDLSPRGVEKIKYHLHCHIHRAMFEGAKWEDEVNHIGWSH